MLAEDGIRAVVCSAIADSSQTALGRMAVADALEKGCDVVGKDVRPLCG